MGQRQQPAVQINHERFMASFDLEATEIQGGYRRSAAAIAALGSRFVLAPARADAVDLTNLDRIAILDAQAKVIWEKLGDAFHTYDVARELAARGAGESQAGSDARDFISTLLRRGLVTADDSAARAAPLSPDPSHATDSSTAPPVVTGAADFIAVIRAFLARQLTVRFRARGRSMRPWIPDGSVLEISPREIDSIRLGQVIAYEAGDQRLVAHRVVGRRGALLLARGDSADRLDEVTPRSLIGLVAARIEDLPGGLQRTILLDGGSSRVAGLVSGFFHRAALGMVRPLVIAPLRRSMLGPSILRRALIFVLRVACWFLRASELGSFKLRRRIEYLWAALMTSGEKDLDRRRLYAKRSVREFTALDENVEAGLTLIEEILLHRHPIPRGRLLVLGCGPGRECIALAQRGFEVTGLDRDAAMLKHAQALAARYGVRARFLEAEAVTFDLGAERFDVVAIFSGLYNMVLPRAERVRMLAASRAHLVPGGLVILTFLSDYVPPGAAPPIATKTFLEAINPEHERGDLYMMNEAVHIHPHSDSLRAEAAAAQLEVVDLFRDQRAYDRVHGQVRGFAVLRRSTD